jgi:hypothetical protein
MNRVGRSSVQKVLTSGALTLLLFCAPTLLAAQERGVPTAGQLSVLDWCASLWSDLTTWLTGGAASSPRPEPPPQSTSDNGCAVDPHGGCGG